MAWTEPEEKTSETQVVPGWDDDKRLEQLKQELIHNHFTVEEVIDSIIELNGMVGVGLISLGDALKEYCYAKVKKSN